jgi:polar amino acid transport system substrate-binding protein/cystine transport system substrate-binding protein/membrane-bound lytic murein transglycosylase F
MALIPAKARTPLSYLMIFGLLAGVYLLPADTSLSEVRRAGLLRACMPPVYPPLVTSDANAPGIDVELLRALADKLALKLAITPNPAIGQDFNPRNWRVTRAQCEMLAGGVVASPVTKSFLETSPSYAETGWALVIAKEAGIQGRRVGVLTGISGLDRLALSRYLRAQGAEVSIVANAADFVAGLRAGRFDVGVTERLLGGQIAAREGWRVDWVAAELPRYPVVFGLWKGDLTLKRAIVGSLETMARDGEMAKILARYIGDARVTELRGLTRPE